MSLTTSGEAARDAIHDQFLAAARADLRDLSDEQLRALADAAGALGDLVQELQGRSGDRRRLQ